METDILEFLAEIKEVKAKKVASGDVVYRLVVESNDPTLHNLGLLNGDTIVNISVEVNHG